MIAFRPRTLWESLRYTFSPAYRRQRDDAMQQAIRELVEQPDLPCSVDGRVIPDGFGVSPGSSIPARYR